MGIILSKFQFFDHNDLRNPSELLAVTERNVAFDMADDVMHRKWWSNNKFLRYGLKRENLKIQLFKYCADPKTNNTIGILAHENIYLATGIAFLRASVAKLCPRSYFSVMAAAVSPRECVVRENGRHVPERPWPQLYRVKIWWRSAKALRRYGPKCVFKGLGHCGSRS